MNEHIREVIRFMALMGLGILYGICLFRVLSQHQSSSIEVRPPEVVYEQLHQVDHDIVTVTNTTKEDEVKRTQHEIDVVAAVVESEARNQQMLGKVAVAATLFNRADATGRGVEIIAREAYAYPYNGPISEESYRAVEIAMNNRDLFPEDMMYFRTEHYHNFGVPYMQIQDHYFSTKE